jgi:uncharacterized membrane protein
MSTTRLRWTLLQITRRIWFRPTLLSVLAVATALVAIAVKHLIPEDFAVQIGADSVDSMLELIATSMLAVTIFSMSTLVSALASASGQVTPRATLLLAQDPTAQNALATFLGAFSFSLFGIIALYTGAYGKGGRVVLFAVTLLVLVLIVVTLLRWINHISKLGRMGDTTARVEAAAERALRDRLAHPHLGALPLMDPAMIPAHAWALQSHRIGYVQHIDMAAVDRLAKQAGVTIFVRSLPGAFTDPTRPLAHVDGRCDDESSDRLRSAFTVGDVRSFDQDPRFGVSVLTEIAQRALSPSLNDPGTAIDVIGRHVRLLSLWARPAADATEPPQFHRVRVPAITIADLFDDAFAAIARDGAGLVEVGLRLQKAFVALAQIGDADFASAATHHSRIALRRAELASMMESDLALLSAAAMRSGVCCARIDVATRSST